MVATNNKFPNKVASLSELDRSLISTPIYTTTTKHAFSEQDDHAFSAQDDHTFNAEDDNAFSAQDNHNFSESSNIPLNAPSDLPMVCRYYLHDGKCLRADCRFSHDINVLICKFWLRGSCLAGDACIFRHELPVEEDNDDIQNDINNDWSNPDNFPALASSMPVKEPVALKRTPDAIDGFPSLDALSLNTKNSNVQPVPKFSQLAENPFPNIRGFSKNYSGSFGKTKNTVHIPPPPAELKWLQTGGAMHAAYMDHRSDAIAHGNERNKMLTLAAEAWRRNDPASAKKFSQLAKEETMEMEAAHERSSQTIFNNRNKSLQNTNIVDLHGLHGNEAIHILQNVLEKAELKRDIVYAIVGTGHHSKQGRDKLGSTVKAWLGDNGYTFREFSFDGTEYGGIIGIVSFYV